MSFVTTAYKYMGHFNNKATTDHIRNTAAGATRVLQRQTLLGYCFQFKILGYNGKEKIVSTVSTSSYLWGFSEIMSRLSLTAAAMETVI
jgi:hypothetical protein